MNDPREEAALQKAAEYELLGSRATDKDKREEYRTRAKFQRSIADELRSRLSTGAESK
jgi:hypothetical protein